MLNLLSLLAAVLLLVAGLLIATHRMRNQQTTQRLFRRLPVVPSQSSAATASTPSSRLINLTKRIIHDPQAVRHTHPTRKLLVAAGFSNEKHYYHYVLICIGLPLLLAIVVMVFPILPARFSLPGIALAVIIGMLLPRRLLHWRAAIRAKMADKELLLFIDLLRMMQGSGMSVGQSLLVCANEFTIVLPVLAPEIALANQRYQGGRDRRDSLEPLADIFNSPDFSALAQLLDRLERYGGASEEPLAKFGERLLEQQRMNLKKIIGHLSVKMTGVMVLFMLPALFILLAGPGMLALIGTLQHTGAR
ncbi:type II secretion system F family protein [Jeongeupia sp. HS-3]|uniref:type II secretion system F family protein n=1 Tax=Jeongeupia sp. HS-3 TaxID=1009682 RepID=UPI0019101676|nr:type II secretion system F family protein [Jeongeupia sp. HS-3]